MPIVYIGLGSNLGDRNKNLESARRLLASPGTIRILAQSSVIETEPVDVHDQPRFLNQVIKIETYLAPHDLLKALKQAEAELGREKTYPKGPRIIDLDILLYGNIIMKTEDLTIPHPGIKNRRFVMQHLAELEPELKDPITGTKYADLMRA